MLCTVLLMLAKPPAVGPSLPAGCDSNFQEACLLVERRLDAGDFAGAKKALLGLPKRVITFAWDDRAVPPPQRPTYADARDRAIRMWRKAIPGVQIKIAAAGDIGISFTEELAQPPGAAIRLAARHSVTQGPKLGVVSVVALSRGNPSVAATVKDVQNEVAYAIGTYLGLAPSPTYGHAMWRTDLTSPELFPVSEFDRNWAKANLAAADRLRTACESRTRLRPTASRLVIVGPTPDKQAALQGDQPVYKLIVSNKGNTDLNYFVASSCDCLTTNAGNRIPPGKSRAVKAILDTTRFFGHLEKHIFVCSNDPQRSMVEIPIVCEVTPRFRFLAPVGDVVLLDGGSVDYDVFLTYPPEAPMGIVSASLQGPDGDIKIVPWQGDLPDPELNEEAKPRKGFKFTVHIPDQKVYDRRQALLTVVTDDGTFFKITFSFYVQKGILALPMQLYLGSRLTGPAEGEIIVSRPGKPFKITRIGCDDPSISAVWAARRGDSEYKVTVRYDGKGKPGKLKALILVQTDDPNTPTIRATVIGEIP